MLSRAHAREPRRVATGSCSASRCCSRWWRPVESRDDAYRIVQRNAMQTWEERRPFLDVLREDPEVTTTLSRRAARRVLRPQARDRQRRPHVRRRSTSPSEKPAADDRSRCRTSTPARSATSTTSGDDRLLMVATDRVSVFDVVLPDLIPDKGRVLTGDLVVLVRPDRRPAAEPRDLASTRPTSRTARGPTPTAGRCSCGARDPVPMECIARGYLFGSAWKEYREQGTVQGRHDADRDAARPSSCPSRCSRRRRRPTSGHDLPMTDAEAIDARRRRHVRRGCATLALAIYERGAAHARDARDHPRRHEVRVRVAPDGELLLIDEVMTPDSSRYWPARGLRGRRVAAVVRQAVRPRPLPRRIGLGQDTARAAGARRR